MGLTEYFAFYNGERYHQALGYKTPDQIYQTAEGGGAMIVDKFNALTEAWVSELERQRKFMLKRSDIHLKILQADSMWTKREFPSERVDKLMENCLGSLPRAYPH